LPTINTTLVGNNTTNVLTNKSLVSPIISTINNTGILTLPTITDTLASRITIDVLTNKTLTSTRINDSLTDFISNSLVSTKVFYNAIITRPANTDVFIFTGSNNTSYTIEINLTCNDGVSHFSGGYSAWMCVINNIGGVTLASQPTIFARIGNPNGTLTAAFVVNVGLNFYVRHRAISGPVGVTVFKLGVSVNIIQCV
jgi:uncharacterized membrane protein